MMNKKVAIMGVGNILLKDEGIGVEVVNKIKSSFSIDKSVKLIDGGIGGYSLIYQIKNINDLILIDAVNAGVEPGKIMKYELNDDLGLDSQGNAPESFNHLSSHEIGVIDVINLSKALYGYPKVVKVFGIQPVDVSCCRNPGVTPKIGATIPKVISLVLDELDLILKRHKTCV